MISGILRDEFSEKIKERIVSIVLFGSVDKSNYRIYLPKAKGFYETMHRAKDRNNWNAVGLNGVHCTISSNDALLVFYAVIRSASADHHELTEVKLCANLNWIQKKSERRKVSPGDCESKRNDFL